MHLLSLLLVGIGLSLVQLLAALPWLAALSPTGFKKHLRRPATGGLVLAGLAAAGIALALQMAIVQDRERLEFWGRLYGAVLQVQLSVDLFVLGFPLLLLVWRRGGAVALAAFREGLRQPMFWLIAGLAAVLLLISLVLPYYTFGDDYKMMKQLGYDIIMLAAVLLGVLAAGISISEEIEGRTAVTLMSKPVSRRQFLLGKYLGILLAGLAMTALLAWVFEWLLYAKPYLEPFDDIVDPLQVQVQPWLVGPAEGMAPTVEAAGYLRGAALWWTATLSVLPGLVIGFCQLMVLLAIAVALATRLPLIVNLVLCLLVFLLGHLAPVLKQVAVNLQLAHQAEHPGGQSATIDLVQFFARLVDTVMPALDLFNLGPAVVRDTPLEIGAFAGYAAMVLVYSLLYAGIALLFGLILFEDRDLA